MLYAGELIKMDKKITRRSFLRKAGGVAAACIGLGIPGRVRAEKQTPQAVQTPKVDADYIRGVKRDRRIEHALFSAMVSGKTPSHMAIEFNNKDMLMIELNHKSNPMRNYPPLVQVAARIEQAYKTHGDILKNVYVN